MGPLPVNPDFTAYAKSFGGFGITVSKKQELEKAMQALLDHQGPGLLEVKADAKLI